MAEKATVHLIVPDEQGKVKMPSGTYRVACNPNLEWAQHMTPALQAASCSHCVSIGERLEQARKAAATEPVGVSEAAEDALARDLAAIEPAEAAVDDEPAEAAVDDEED